ncbi:PREDICTED: homer protein homolog 3-like [Camelina sativa]|uniref:Homer protein homolog 3-like n=1 Tax=Camelina sativa TaxID=90675 RepID=A0ABM1RRZ5_CAMSA|nr:PREDICTED: homer protein homolog 3-like [Camelina sativa]
MAAALAEGKARLPKKSGPSTPEVDGTSAPPAGPSEPLTGASGPLPSSPEPAIIVVADSSDEPHEVITPSVEVSSQRADSSKKRKEPEISSTFREKSRARSGSSGDERSKSSSKDRVPSSESGDSSSKLPSKERRPSPRVPPASPGDLMRSYTRPGVRVPAFADMSELNRANFFFFADKIGELMIEFNSSVASYEDQLFASPSSSEVSLLREKIADLEAQVKEYARLEAENATTVERAEQIRARMKKAEVQVLDLGIANEDLRDKLKKAEDLYYEAAEDAKAAKNRLHEIELRNQLLEAGNTCEIERVRREERQAMRRTLRPLVEEVKVTFEEREKLAPAKIRAAEIRANRMLIEEISRGEIQDMEAELGLLKADEEEADDKVSKVTLRDLDLSGFSDLLADTPDLLCSEHPLSITIDESGTNLGQMSNQGMDDFLANTKSVEELEEMGLALSEAASDPAPHTQ